MTELLLILGVVAIREMARALPPIVWSVPGNPDSANYKLPAPIRPDRRR